MTAAPATPAGGAPSRPCRRRAPTVYNAAGPSSRSARPGRKGAAIEALFDAAAFAADGFCVVTGAVAPPKVAALREAVERVQRGVASLPPELVSELVFERDLSSERRGGVTAEDVGDAIYILADPPRFDPVFEELLGEPALAAIAAAALGTDRLAAHFMNVTIKHPRFGRSISWHRDFPNSYVCTARARFVRLMLSLDGMDPDSGATAFVPGSHLVDDAEAAAAGSARRLAEEQAGRVLTVVCAPGDMVVVHPKVVHGGGGNRSDRWRRNLIVQIGDVDEPVTVAEQRTSVTGWRVAPTERATRPSV